MKAPFVIYVDFEALVRKFHLCERGPQERASKSYTEKTEWHEASGYSYMVLRSDGEVTGSKVYRGENAVGMFLSDIVQEEAKIREIFAAPKPIAMTNEDWQKHKNATECHICDKSLKKDNFLDSMPVYDHNTGSYCGQSHKKCHYSALKQMEFIGPKNERKTRDRIDEWIAKKTGNMFVLCRTFVSEKLYRRSKRPLPRNRQIPRGRAQRVQCKTAHIPQNNPNTCCVSQPEGLRRTPFDASDCAAQIEVTTWRNT